jgi:zinc protease
LQSPGYRLNRAFSKGLLPPGDPALREATPATVDSLVLNNVRDFYARTYRPDLTTIVVVGDVTPAQARAEVEKYFGSWKATGPKPDVVPAAVPLNPPAYTVVPNTYASQDQVVLGQMVDLTLDDTDRYALQLGNEVLGGNGFASRLMVDIRVKHGYAYGAGSGMHFDRTRSIFYVEYGSDPEKVAPVDSLILRDVTDMQQNPILATELNNARQAEIRSIPVAVSSVGSIAASLLYWSWHGEPLNQPMIAARHYLDLSAGDVQEAFRKYLEPGHLTQVVEGPAPARH